MVWRALRVAFLCGSVVVVAVPACGGRSADSGAGSGAGGNNAGAGTSSSSSAGAGTAGKTATGAATACGTSTCAGIVIPLLQNLEIPGCCADPDTSRCGLDSSVLSMFGQTVSEACQPLAQPGTKDVNCPGSTSLTLLGAALPIQLPGCCQASGMCGYQLDSVANLIQLGLGCVDATPFLDGGVATPCGDAAAGGEGGMGGAGPAPVSEGATLGEAASGAAGS